MSHRRSSMLGRFLAACVAGAVLGAPGGALALLATSSIHRALFHFDEWAGSFTTDGVSGGDACLGATFSAPCPLSGAMSPTWTSGRYGSALSFDGVDDTVTFPHTPSLDWSATNNHVVLEAWIKPAQGGTIVSKGGAAGFNYRLRLDAAGNLSFSYTDVKGIAHTLSSPLGKKGQGAPVSFGQWHWVSVSFGEDSNVIEMRVDGGRNDKLTNALKPRWNAPDPSTNLAALSIGSFGGTSDFFGGAIDEVRITITPDAANYAGGYPQVGSDRGVVLSRVEFAPATGSDFIELYRPDLGDGAAPVSLSMVYVYDGDGNFYTVPSVSGRCAAGNMSCYQVSPGETVRIWLNGSRVALDGASTIFSEWYTSNCSTCTLGDGGTSDLGTVDHVRIRSSGFPMDPDNARALLNADVVVWGGDQSTNPNFAPMVAPEGIWPSKTAFVATTPTTTGIALQILGDNLQGPGSWVALGP